MSDELTEAVAALNETLRTVEQYLADQNPDYPVQLQQDHNGRFLLLDAQTAVVMGLSAKALALAAIAGAETAVAEAQRTSWSARCDECQWLNRSTDRQHRFREALQHVAMWKPIRHEVALLAEDEETVEGWVK